MEWLDGTCKRKDPKIEASSADSSPGGCRTVDPHGNADEGHSTLHLMPLRPHPHLFMCKFPPLSKAPSAEMASWGNGILMCGRRCFLEEREHEWWKNRIRGAPEINISNEFDGSTGSDRDFVYLFTNLTCFQEVIKSTLSVEWRKVMIQKYISTSIKMRRFH